MTKIALIIFGAMMIASTTLRAQEVKPIEASIMKRIIRIYLLISGILLSACKQNIKEDAADFVFSTENVEGDEAYYSKPAVITGHIANREVYPNTKDVSVTIPFYDRVDMKQTSGIYEDRFAFSLVPYAPRTISMEPFVEHMMVCPGDSIHVQLDFAEMGVVSFSGRGADNNVKLNDFHMHYYLNADWPSHGEGKMDSAGNMVRKYKGPKSLAEALKKQLNHHLSRYEAFVANMNPSQELAILCRKEIEADYYSKLLQGLMYYNIENGEPLSKYFKVKDAEHLFDPDYVNSNLFELSSNIGYWLLANEGFEAYERLIDDYPSLVKFINKATRNKMLRQMLTAHFYNQLLEANDVESFEEYFNAFNETVTFPLLKLNTRDRYALKKSFQQNPKLLSDAILNADKPREGQVANIKPNGGLALLRSIIAKNEDKVIYVNIGATWCPGTKQELPYLQELAAAYQGKPLRIVNFYIDQGKDGVNSLDIETYHLTDEQRLGLDPILHLGAGIPFYILIDKDGVIVDFGEHLRPSIPETRGIIDKYISE